jgi:eukaryotic-like serine/threonine-protein kinase
VIHRDLKPTNVMVGSFGEVQVMDWGLAKVLPRGGAVEDASAGRPKDRGTVIATARTGSDFDLSQAGSIMGTPSYMAPEQARGEGDQVDERADVFALGSIFCELLTGEPAFIGRNSGEIQRKAARGEVADAIARLDQNSLGHDPELIALAKACLAPERDDRPRNAGEVSERMGLYHSRVQERLRQSEIARAEEKARAEEATKRASVERDRFRLTVALAASVLGFIVLGGGGWAYVSQQRAARKAATERLVTEALDKTTLLRGQAKAAPLGDLSKWSEARAAANEARSILEAGEPSVALRSRVAELLATLEKEQADASHRATELDKDRKLFDRLDALRFEFVNKQDIERPYGTGSDKIDNAYADAFREFGIDVDRLEPAEAGRLLKQRPNPQEFAARIDDWTLIRKAASAKGDKNSWNRLILTAQATDGDSWRNSLRSLAGNDDHEAARRLASDEKELSRQPARSLYLLARVLESTRDGNYHDYYLKESLDILKRAWRLSPNDYQICRTLAAYSENHRDRVVFSAAAVAARPNFPDARHGLAEAVLPANARTWGFAYTTGDFPDPDPSNWKSPRFLVKSKSGRRMLVGPQWPCSPKAILHDDLSEAVAELRSAIRLAPGSTDFHMSLAIALVIQGGYDEAMNEGQLVARIDPKYNQSDTLASALYCKGQVDLAVEVIKQDIARDPDDKLPYRLLGLIYHEQGKKELAFAAYRQVFSSSHRQTFLITQGIALLEDTGTPEGLRSVYREAIDAERQEAVAQLRFAIELFPEASGACNAIAWELATNRNPKLRDGTIAVLWAKQACELTDWRNPAYLDTLAAAHAESRDFEAAVKCQSKAIELRDDEKEKKDLRTRLKLYQAKRPYHTASP